jgi:hypothetical protein
VGELAAHGESVTTKRRVAQMRRGWGESDCSYPGRSAGVSASGTIVRPTTGKATTRLTRQKSAEAVLAAGI